jgi:hypothetical protein
MAKHRIRRWLQFGVLDLLILTVVVAVIIRLSQPAPTKAAKAPPWVVGAWGCSDLGLMELLPDGYYSITNLASPVDFVEGAGWTLAYHGALQDAFVLRCGERRFIVRGESDSGMLDLLNDDGTVKSQLKQVAALEGPSFGRVPHGTWNITPTSVFFRGMSLEYRHGELTDVRQNGRRDLAYLNQVRKVLGFPELTERDFPDAGKSEEKIP